MFVRLSMAAALIAATVVIQALFMSAGLIDSVSERGRDDYRCRKKRLDLKGRHGVRFLGC